MIDVISNELKKVLYKNNEVKDDALYIEVSTQNNDSIINNIKKGVFNEWNIERIKGAFNLGSGTLADFKRYADNNKNYCKIYQL